MYEEIAGCVGRKGVKGNIMTLLLQNWPILLFAGVMIYMHVFMHRGHGAHGYNGGNARRGNDARDPANKQSAQASQGPRGSHMHGPPLNPELGGTSDANEFHESSGGGTDGKKPPAETNSITVSSEKAPREHHHC